ncbi:hypothetical protein EMCRGX_G010348 [Ephydatia muelleri]|eukprot:Em0003g1604a
MEEKFPPAVPPADPPQCEAHSSQGEAIPTKEGAEPPQGNAYPPQDGTYIYPPQGETYPLQAEPTCRRTEPTHHRAEPTHNRAEPTHRRRSRSAAERSLPAAGRSLPGIPATAGRSSTRFQRFPSSLLSARWALMMVFQSYMHNYFLCTHILATPQQQTNVVIVQPRSTAPVHTKVGDYGYTLSIVLTVICFLCGSWCSLCLSIPAIFVASSARDAAARGDLLGAKRKGHIANSLNAGAVIAFVLLWVMIVIRL